MFNIGILEMLIIGVIALIFVGPKQLPEVARTVARFINDWKTTTSEISRSIMTADYRDVSENRPNQEWSVGSADKSETVERVAEDQQMEFEFEEDHEPIPEEGSFHGDETTAEIKNDKA